MVRIMLVKKICTNPEFAEKAALWFSKKWGISFNTYYASIKECIEKKDKIPQWYIVLNNDDKIIAGAGVIDNDFHDRKDLTPNLCALFVEEKYRGQGIAGKILNFVRKDLGAMGFKQVYLVTDHTEFYERYGWEFFCMVTDNEGVLERMYAADTL